MSVKEEVKVLWKVCFEDTDEFVDLYFEKVYRDEINMDIRCDGRLVSALQMIPYPMKLYGTIVDASYISGASTYPEFRGQGAMRELLMRTLRRMYEDGACLSMLIPWEEWLFGYYARMGYVDSFAYHKQNIWKVDICDSQSYTIKDELEHDDLFEGHFQYQLETMKKRPCCVLHLKDDFRVILADLRLSKGKLLVARRGGLIRGMAFGVMEKERLAIKELLADNEDVRHSLLKSSMEMFQVEELECLCPASDGAPVLGMARVIHAEKMLDLFASRYPEKEMYICLKDEIITENNAFYNLKQGRCIRGQWTDREYRLYSISELTLLLLQNENPYMSLMLN